MPITVSFHGSEPTLGLAAAEGAPDGGGKEAGRAQEERQGEGGVKSASGSKRHGTGSRVVAVESSPG